LNQEVLASIKYILPAYGLRLDDFQISPIGSGYIHLTYLLKGNETFILQRVNKNVFQQPEDIASNLKIASRHIQKNYPDYKFLTAKESLQQEQMVYDPEGYPWRIFAYFENTCTIDEVENVDQAFSAAAEFARLVRYLDDVDVHLFKPTIPRFHDLSLRYEQFLTSLKHPVTVRISEATPCIQDAMRFSFLVDEYEKLIESGHLKLRVTHNDTKINNILFDVRSSQAVCAIDLDTLMPGYVMYDIGDMIRTFVSEVDEEEKDLSKVNVRPAIYKAVVNGYLSQMGDRLHADEINAIHFSGMMMTYIMALRMLTDYLNGDVYYKISYTDQNLVRARNQFKLLHLLKDFSK
jgi:Ser/Thr protein kinase RdoA (MazF antagonist)